MPLTFIRKLSLAAVAAVTLTLLTTLWNGIASAQTLLPAQDYPRSWDREFPLGDFSRSIVDYDEILSGGPPRDGIPAIDAPKFVSIAEAAERYAPTEPVIGLEVNGEARPLRRCTRTRTRTRPHAGCRRGGPSAHARDHACTGFGRPASSALSSGASVDVCGG